MAQPGATAEGSREAEILENRSPPPRTQPASTAPVRLCGPGQPRKEARPEHPGHRSCLHPSRPSFSPDPETWALSGTALKRMDFKDVWYPSTRTTQPPDQKHASSQNLPTRAHSSQKVKPPKRPASDEQTDKTWSRLQGTISQP